MKETVSPEAVLCALHRSFGTTTVNDLFEAVYDWWFVPRNSLTRVEARTAVEKLVCEYYRSGTIPDWFCEVKDKIYLDIAWSGDMGAVIKAAMDKVISEHPRIVAFLGRTHHDWIQALPLLDDLVFVEVFGELAINPPGIPHYYEPGAGDPRWKIIHYTQVAGSTIGQRYFVEALEQRQRDLLTTTLEE